MGNTYSEFSNGSININPLVYSKKYITSIASTFTKKNDIINFKDINNGVNIYITYQRINGRIYLNILTIRYANSYLYIYVTSINNNDDKTKLIYVTECDNPSWINYVKIDNNFKSISLIQTNNTIAIYDLFDFLGKKLTLLYEATFESDSLSDLNTIKFMIYEDSYVKILKNKIYINKIIYNFDIDLSECLIRISENGKFFIVYDYTKKILYTSKDEKLLIFENIVISSGAKNTLTISDDGKIVFFYQYKNDKSELNFINLESHDFITLTDTLKLHPNKLINMNYWIKNYTSEYNILNNECSIFDNTNGTNTLYVLSGWDKKTGIVGLWFYNLKKVIFKTHTILTNSASSDIEFIQKNGGIFIYKYRDEILIHDMYKVIIVNIIKYFKNEIKFKLVDIYKPNYSQSIIYLEDANNNICQYYVNDFARLLMDLESWSKHNIYDNIHIKVSVGKEKSFDYFSGLIQSKIKVSDIIHNLPERGKEASIISILEHFYCYTRILILKNSETNNLKNQHQNYIIYYIGYIILEFVLEYYIWLFDLLNNDKLDNDKHISSDEMNDGNYTIWKHNGIKRSYLLVIIRFMEEFKLFEPYAKKFMEHMMGHVKL